MNRSLFSSVLLTLGIFFFVLSLFLFRVRYSAQNLAFASVPQSVLHANAKLPVQIILPALGETLPVIPAKITHDTWETTDKGISYLTSSAIPGEKGNAVFYGHNFTSLFGRLHELEVGSKIIIKDEDGIEKQFTVTHKKIVDPTDVSILQPTIDSRITLYTCTGFLDSQRLVVTAVLSH